MERAARNKTDTKIPAQVFSMLYHKLEPEKMFFALNIDPIQREAYTKLTDLYNEITKQKKQ